jgi:hypothetical protein
MSPRRSSRARSSANPPNTSQTGNPSSLKNSRTAQRSESIEGSTNQEDDPTNEPIMPRRSRRNGADDAREASQSLKQEEVVDQDQQAIEEDPEEVTRCICGRSEYPGPSPAVVTAAGLSGNTPNLA